MKRFLSRSCFCFVVAACLLAGLSSAPATAQTPLDIRVIYERIEKLEQQLGAARTARPSNAVQMPTVPSEAGMEQQALPSDVASRLQVRLLQLERLVETQTGQMEQAQFDLSQLRAQVQQMSSDVSYRLAVLEQAAGVSSAVAAAPPGVGGVQTSNRFRPLQTPVVSQPGNQQAGLPSQPVTTAPVSGRVEPDLNMPISAPVQPQPQIIGGTPGQAAAPSTSVGGPAPAGTVMLEQGQTLTAPVQAGPVNQGNTFGVIATDSAGNALPPAPGAASAPVQQAPQPVVQAPPRIAAAPTPGPVAAAQIGTAASPLAAMTSLPAGTPQEQYDYAFDILRRADYGRAESALRMFLEANPQDSLAGNAQYWLGETFYVRGDFEQAAVEFLSGYQTFPSSNKAPDNLLKLGLSMARLGQTDGACTALSRLATEYPEANDTIRRRAQTERARLSCS